MQYNAVTFSFSSVRQLGGLIGICCTDLVKDTIFNLLNLLNQLNHTPHPSQRKFPVCAVGIAFFSNPSVAFLECGKELNWEKSAS